MRPVIRTKPDEMSEYEGRSTSSEHAPITFLVVILEQLN